MESCKTCGRWLDQTEGRRKKQFCNNTCRYKFWYGKHKKGDKKQVVQDSIKPTNYFEPQISSKSNFVAYTPPHVKTHQEWILEKREIEDGDIEAYKRWIYQLDNCGYLTGAEKTNIKHA